MERENKILKELREQQQKLSELTTKDCEFYKREIPIIKKLRIMCYGKENFSFNNREHLIEDILLGRIMPSSSKLLQLSKYFYDLANIEAEQEDSKKILKILKKELKK